MINRRKFLTHSAATIGGVAMAGSVVDGMLANVANAAVGVGLGNPSYGGTLTVGLSADVPSLPLFNGAHGKWDAPGYARGAAIYDTLVEVNKNGNGVLPSLATSWSSSNNYKTWTFNLRSNVKFHDGSDFTADDVLANIQSCMSDATVGPAIIPIFASSNWCVKVDPNTIQFNTAFPMAQFPIWMADAQIGRIASGKNWNTGASAATNQANPNAPLALAYGGDPTNTPIGTGPFKVTGSSAGVVQTSKFNNYWKTDAKGNKLPYLDGVTFKVIIDPTSRNNALQSGDIDILHTTDGSSILALKTMGGVSVRTDTGDKRDPATNSIILNSTGTLNQWGMWYSGKDFSGGAGAAVIPGIYPYLKKNGTITALLANGLTLDQINGLYGMYNGSNQSNVAAAAGGGVGGATVAAYIAGSALPAGYPAGVDLGAGAHCMPPVSVQNNLYGWVGGKPGNWLIDPNNTYSKPANFLNINGAMKDDGSTWIPGKFNPLTDLDFRKACAAAINRATYLKNIDSGVGVKADGPYKPNSRFYNANNGYPSFSQTAARASLATYKANNPGRATSFTLQYTQGSNAAIQAFGYIQNALSAVGITVVGNAVDPVTLIQNCINGTYDASTWAQFGGVDPSENYVWWNSQNLKDELYFWSLGSTYATGGADAVNIAGAVNFAHQADPALQAAMKAACAAPVATDAVNQWKTVAARFGANVNYLWLDATVTAWAARDNVHNWANATDGGTPATKTVKGKIVNYLTYGKILSPNGGQNHFEYVWKA